MLDPDDADVCCGRNFLPILPRILAGQPGPEFWRRRHPCHAGTSPIRPTLDLCRGPGFSPGPSKFLPWTFQPPHCTLPKVRRNITRIGTRYLADVSNKRTDLCITQRKARKSLHLTCIKSNKEEGVSNKPIGMSRRCPGGTRRWRETTTWRTRRSRPTKLRRAAVPLSLPRCPPLS